MNHASLDRMPAAPCYTPEESLHRGIRQRLQGVVNQAGKSGAVFINGERFSTEHVQFLINNFHLPKLKK